MVFHGFERFEERDGAEGCAVDGFDAIARAVETANIERIHVELAREIIDGAFHGERRDRRAGRTIGRDFRAVRHHIVAGERDVFDVVAREGGHAGGVDGRAREGAGLVFQREITGSDPAFAGGAEFDLHHRARRWAAGVEDFIAAHHHLHRAAALLGERERDGFEIDGGFAAEAAADFGGDHFEIAERHAEDFCGERAHQELALA